jgi:hypothetical protein
VVQGFVVVVVTTTTKPSHHRATVKSWAHHPVDGASNSSHSDDSCSCLLLLSLQWTTTSATTTTENDPTIFSKPVQDVWRWKDAVLGDGRDFFVPKPKSLRALQDAIMQLLNNRIMECVVLSNCARFEILLHLDDVASKQQLPTLPSNDIDDLLYSISSFFLDQVQCYQQQQKRNLSPQLLLLMPMDNPGLIVPVQKTTAITHTESSHVKELSRHWSIQTNVRDIVEHICAVAAGMAERPRRPGRIVPFRPFSSRDAHILLQLKRTLDGTNHQHHDGGTTTMLLLPKIVQTAIRAGRAARNPKIVPELVQLRQSYGTGDSKYDIEPPMEVSKRVAEASTNKI